MISYEITIKQPLIKKLSDKLIEDNDILEKSYEIKDDEKTRIRLNKEMIK